MTEPAPESNPYLAKLARLRKKTQRTIWEAINEGGMTVFDLQEVTGDNWRYLADVAGKLGTEETAADTGQTP